MYICTSGHLSGHTKWTTKSMAHWEDFSLCHLSEALLNGAVIFQQSISRQCPYRYRLRLKVWIEVGEATRRESVLWVLEPPVHRTYWCLWALSIWSLTCHFYLMMNVWSTTLRLGGSDNVQLIMGSSVTLRLHVPAIEHRNFKKLVEIINNSTHLTELFWGPKEIMYKWCLRHSLSPTKCLINGSHHWLVLPVVASHVGLLKINALSMSHFGIPLTSHWNVIG